MPGKLSLRGAMVKVLRIRGSLENLNQREMHRTPSKCSECLPLMQQRGLVHFTQNAKIECLSPCIPADVSVTCMFRVLYNAQPLLLQSEEKLFCFFFRENSLLYANPEPAFLEPTVTTWNHLDQVGSVSHLQPQGCEDGTYSSVGSSSSDHVFLILLWF